MLPFFLILLIFLVVQTSQESSDEKCNFFTRLYGDTAITHGDQGLFDLVRILRINPRRILSQPERFERRDETLDRLGGSDTVNKLPEVKISIIHTTRL